jgi:hypothetical protein
LCLVILLHQAAELPEADEDLPVLTDRGLDEVAVEFDLNQFVRHNGLSGYVPGNSARQRFWGETDVDRRHRRRFVPLRR